MPAAATPAAATKTAAAKATVEAAAMKASTAAVKLGFGRGRDHRDRRRHSERGNGRDYGLLDGVTHGKILPLSACGRILSLKLCQDGKSSRVCLQPRAKN
jgi:hypothetical protein